MIQKYIISLPPITKKNSQQILTNHRTGKPFIAPSRQYKKYEQAAMWLPHPKAESPAVRPLPRRHGILYADPPPCGRTLATAKRPHKSAP